MNFKLSGMKILAVEAMLQERCSAGVKMISEIQNKKKINRTVFHCVSILLHSEIHEYD